MYRLGNLALMAVMFSSGVLSGPLFPRSYATTTTLTQIYLAEPSPSPSFSRSFSLDRTAPVAFTASASKAPGFWPVASMPSASVPSGISPSGVVPFMIAPSGTMPTVPYASGTGTPFSPTTTTSPTSSNGTAPNPTSSNSTNSTTSPTFLRGVNIGNWLVLEKWMDSTSLFSGQFSGASDQYTFDQINGAQSALQEHWSTWFTESDVSYIASLGLNAIRIPIGYWAYNNTGTPYLTGAADYLDQAVGWARDHNLKVWVDCHGSPGSQNGFDNSGQAGSANWQFGDNIQQSISVLTQMAAKYGSSDYSDVVVGLELVNEPISWGNNQLSTTLQFARDAYAQVKSASANPHLNVIMHDSFVPATQWSSLPSDVGTTTSRQFHLDTHLYQVFDDKYKSLDGSGHVSAACVWGSQLSTADRSLPIHVGEWSAAMDICVNPDGTTSSGSSCTQQGCQCTGDNILSWNNGLKEQTRRFVEAQLDAFEQNASGYFLWAYKGPGAWGLKNLVDRGMFPNPVTKRNFPGQCGGSGSTSSRRRESMRRRLARSL